MIKYLYRIDYKKQTTKVSISRFWLGQYTRIDHQLENQEIRKQKPQTKILRKQAKYEDDKFKIVLQYQIKLLTCEF